MKRGRVSYCSIMYGFTQDLEFGGVASALVTILMAHMLACSICTLLFLLYSLYPSSLLQKYYCTCSTCVYNVHVLMRDERRMEERSKQDQTNMAKQHSTSKAVTYKVHVSCGLLCMCSCALCYDVSFCSRPLHIFH